jgi:hypothetical protein
VAPWPKRREEWIWLGCLDWIGSPCEFVCDVCVMPMPRKKKNATVQASGRR